MTPEAQRIAIAEACGWAHASVGPFAHPDYLTDLNAMHEAEKVLTNAQRERYRTELVYKLAGGDVFATAAQKAEAFLWTIGKWEGEP